MACVTILPGRCYGFFNSPRHRNVRKHVGCPRPPDRRWIEGQHENHNRSTEVWTFCPNCEPPIRAVVDLAWDAR